MAENERSLSDFTSSVEQENLPQKDPIHGETVKQKLKRSKLFSIAIGIFLVLVIAAGGYTIYGKYFSQVEAPNSNEIENEEKESEYKSTIDEVVMTLLGQNLTLSAKLPTSSCDDTGFVSQVEENSKFLIYKDNQNGYCSDSHMVQFFVDEENMSQIISNGNAKYPLEKIVVDGIEYEYIEKKDSAEENGAVSGTVYMKNPKLLVGGYEAFRVLSFYNLLSLNNSEADMTDEEVIRDGSITTYCVFDLSKINPKAKGYLMFSGFASIGSEINYCDMLNSTEEFEIKIY